MSNAKLVHSICVCSRNVRNDHIRVKQVFEVRDADVSSVQDFVGAKALETGFCRSRFDYVLVRLI
jgi:hypothetical protein